MWLTFDPDVEGVTTDTLSILSDDTDEPFLYVPLSGRGTAPHVGFSPTSLTFGAQDIDNGPTAAQTIEVKNVGEATLAFTGAGFSIDGEFQIANTPSTADLAPGDSVLVDITFDPSTIGPKVGALHVATNDPTSPIADAPLSGTGAQFEGAPLLQSGVDNGNAGLTLVWTNPNELPGIIYSLSYDIYNQAYVDFGAGAGAFFPSLPVETSSTLPLASTGAYHAWVGNYYPNADWFVCPVPYTGIQYSGVPHTILDAAAADKGSNLVRLSWRPDIYGCWLYEFIAFKGGEGFVAVDGPSAGMGFDPWTILDYGGLAYDPSKASFLDGWAEFTVPGPGEYWFYLRNVGWLPPYLPGEWVLAHVVVQ